MDPLAILRQHHVWLVKQTLKALKLPVGRTKERVLAELRGRVWQANREFQALRKEH